MPNIKSAKKRMRSNAKKTEVNTLVTSSMRTAIKKFEKEVKAGNDLKMHCGYPEDLKKALDSGDLTRADLEVCTRRILEMFMKLA